MIKKYFYTYPVLMGTSFISAVFFVIVICLITVQGLIDRHKPVKYGVVLGTKVNEDGKPSVYLAGRLEAAIDLFHRKYIQKIIVSGGTGDSGFNEGRTMAAYLMERGIPKDVIIIEDQASNSHDTVAFTARLLKSERLDEIMVITQFYHIPRVVYAFRQFGVKNVYQSHSIYFTFRDIFGVIREVPAHVKYRYFKKYDL